MVNRDFINDFNRGVYKMAYGESHGSGESIKVEKLEPSSREVNVSVKVVSKTAVRDTISRSDGSTHRVTDALVGDETGCIYLTLWDDNIERVKDGDTIAIRNGYISLFRGSMRLNIGRYGSFEPTEATIGEVKTDNNLSDKQYEQQPRYPTFRPSFRDEGYRGGSGGRRGYRPRRRY